MRISLVCLVIWVSGFSFTATWNYDRFCFKPESSWNKRSGICAVGSSLVWPLFWSTAGIRHFTKP